MAPSDGVDPDALDSSRGWVVVALTFFALVVLWGSVFTFTVYADALASSFGLSSFSTSAIFSIGTAAFFVAGGLVGILVARAPLRPVVLSAEAVDVLTSAGIARSVAATAFGLVGGVSIASRVASGGVADWIGPRRTLAAGVVLTALGLFFWGGPRRGRVTAPALLAR